MEALIILSVLIFCVTACMQLARINQKKSKALEAKFPKPAKPNYNRIVDAKLDEWVKEHCLVDQNTQLIEQLKGSEIF